LRAEIAVRESNLKSKTGGSMVQSRVQSGVQSKVQLGVQLGVQSKVQCVSLAEIAYLSAYQRSVDRLTYRDAAAKWGVPISRIRGFELLAPKRLIRACYFFRLLNALELNPTIVVDGERLRVDYLPDSLEIKPPEEDWIDYRDLAAIVCRSRSRREVTFGKVEYSTGICRTTVFDYESGKVRDIRIRAYLDLLAYLEFDLSVEIGGARYPIETSYGLLWGRISPTLNSKEHWQLDPHSQSLPISGSDPIGCHPLRAYLSQESQ